MRTGVTTVATTIDQNGDITIHATANSAVASIALPAAAASALAALLTSDVNDRIDAPGWQTPAQIRAARIAAGEPVEQQD